MERVKATCAVIYNAEGKLLFIKRGREPFRGYWALISGIGETLRGVPLDRAIQGEVQCDLQTALLNPKKLFFLPVENDTKIDGTVVFSGTVDESQIKMHPPFSLAYRWVSKEEVASLGKLAFEHNHIIKQYLG